VVVRDDVAVFRQDEAAAGARGGRGLAPDVGGHLRGDAADRADVHLVDLRRGERLARVVGRERIGQRPALKAVGALVVRGLRGGLSGRFRLDSLLGHGVDAGLLPGEVFLSQRGDRLLQRVSAGCGDDRHDSEQGRDLEAGMPAAAADLLFDLLQRLRGFGGHGVGRFKAVVQFFIVIVHRSVLLVSLVQKRSAGSSSMWLTRLSESRRRMYGWKRKLTRTKSGSLPTSWIVVLQPACRMAARQAS